MHFDMTQPAPSLTLIEEKRQKLQSRSGLIEKVLRMTKMLILGGILITLLLFYPYQDFGLKTLIVLLAILALQMGLFIITSDIARSKKSDIEQTLTELEEITPGAHPHTMILLAEVMEKNSTVRNYFIGLSKSRKPVLAEYISARKFTNNQDAKLMISNAENKYLSSLSAES